MGGKVGENPAALRAAVFSLASKNRRGGGAFKRPPPSRARVNNSNYVSSSAFKFSVSNFQYLTGHQFYASTEQILTEVTQCQKL